MSNTEALRAAAQAVLDRWDSPQWEWTKHSPTADLMANLRAALDADLNVQVESAITQVQAVHAAFNAGASQQPAASGEPAATLYVEVRECPECQHIDINDDNGQAACTHCDWHGPSPEEDHCPSCGSDGTMTSACIKCGHRTTLLGAATLPVPAPAASKKPMTERDQFDMARWHARLGELADAYYEAGRTNPARQRARVSLMMHALDCATGWRARSAAPQPAPARVPLTDERLNAAGLDYALADSFSSGKAEWVAQDIADAFKAGARAAERYYAAAPTAQPSESNPQR